MDGFCPSKKTTCMLSLGSSFYGSLGIPEGASDLTLGVELSSADSRIPTLSLAPPLHLTSSQSKFQSCASAPPSSFAVSWSCPSQAFLPSAHLWPGHTVWSIGRGRDPQIWPGNPLNSLSDSLTLVASALTEGNMRTMQDWRSSIEIQLSIDSILTCLWLSSRCFIRTATTTLTST